MEKLVIKPKFDITQNIIVRVKICESDKHPVVIAPAKIKGIRTLSELKGGEYKTVIKYDIDVTLSSTTEEFCFREDNIHSGIEAIFAKEDLYTKDVLITSGNFERPEKPINAEYTVKYTGDKQFQNVTKVLNALGFEQKGMTPCPARSEMYNDSLLVMNQERTYTRLGNRSTQVVLDYDTFMTINAG